jgi:poly-gamma-glutamate system protein
MDKISIRSTLILLILAVLSVACFVIVEMTKVDKKQDWYNEKLQAAQLAEKANAHIKLIHYGDAEILDNINDPNETGLIGEEFTSITTGEGSLPIKLSTTNPNFAAMVVQLIKDAELEKGDNVAVCMTGSFPGLNIATLAAIQTLELNPVIICSVTSSGWGATNPEFTWLDMQNELNKANLITAKSVAASIGGNQDIGMALSNEGRQKVMDAINRNNVNFINNDSLPLNIAERLKYINDFSKGKPIKLFINIGGGTASIGSDANGNAVPSGLNEDIMLKDIPDKQGILFEMAKSRIPIIHLLNLEGLMKTYDLPRNPVPLPEVGTGKLFIHKKYNLPVVIISTLSLISLIIAVAYQDKKRHELGTEIVKDDQQV